MSAKGIASDVDLNRPPRPQEVDAWYGSFSPLAMVPEFLWFCGLTLVLLGIASFFPQRSPARIGILVLLALVWLLQVLIGLYGLFAYNYRLTNFRLFKERGLLLHTLEMMELATIADVRVEQAPIGAKLRVGNIVAVQKGSGKTLVLEAVRHPQEVVKQIHELRRLALEMQRERYRGEG